MGWGEIKVTRGEIKVTRTFTCGLVYHVLNRANGRLRLFKKDDDYLAFLRVLLQARERVPIRILDWCLMPNHFHLVLWPKSDGELTRFMRWLTLTHAQRWKHAHAAVGQGHLYQGRFKSFPVQAEGAATTRGGRRSKDDPDRHLLAVCRYVERNAVRAGLARRAAAWRWGSAWARANPDAAREAGLGGLLHEPWPVDRPANWERLLDEPQTDAEQEAVLHSIKRGRPLGDERWVQRTAQRLGLGHTLRPPGRPKKEPEGDKTTAGKGRGAARSARAEAAGSG